MKKIVAIIGSKACSLRQSLKRLLSAQELPQREFGTFEEFQKAYPAACIQWMVCLASDNQSSSESLCDTDELIHKGLNVPSCIPD